MNITVNGKTIGKLLGDTFVKRVKGSQHLMRKLNAWGIDWGAFSRYLRDGTTIKIVDTETNKAYLADSEVWSEHGKIADYGHGEQIFLPLKHFDIISKQKKLL